MPTLPPDLYREIVDLLAPRLRLVEERDAQLLIFLSQWPGFNKIQWEGPPEAFTTRLVLQLPHPELQQILNGLMVGEQDRPQIVALCERLTAVAQLTGTATSDPLRQQQQAAVQQLTGPKYQLDERFVQLTLLLDQGTETPGLRFIPDERRHQYNSLATLLLEVDERALVLLGRPGSGKTTLLRRLQLEQSWAELAEPNGRFPFFISLNGYRPESPHTLLTPQTWLAAAWGRQYPQLPPLEALLQEGRLTLLLDGLNEMPHHDPADYRQRVGQWQLFLQQTGHWGNTVVFSCRSLDYSASLSSEALPVRQVQVEPLTPPQIETFLRLYLAEQAEAVWSKLQPDAKQLTLFANPFFLRLLVEQVTATGEMPRGRAALLTGFVRQALWREVAERGQPPFTPGRLLSEADVQQVLHRAWASATALPEEGALLPQLARLAYGMQAGQASPEARQVRLRETLARTLLGEEWANEVIAAGVQLNLLDKELATRELLFSHQLLQEYFAARLLAQSPEPARLAVAWRADAVRPSLAETVAGLAVSDPLPGLPTTGWEETTLLAAALTATPEPFVADLMAVNLPLAARCAAAAEVHVSAGLVGRLQQALLARLGDPAADLRARIAAAEALGELGDPRFERQQGAHGAYLRPPLVDIAAGSYPMGSGDYEDEQPLHRLDIAAFAIGMFPLTNAEFGLFMAAGGYEAERWWPTAAAKAWWRGEMGNEGQLARYQELQTALQGISDEQLRALPNVTPEQIELYLWLKQASSEALTAQVNEWHPAGKRYRQPGFWQDSRFNQATQPVVGICWYEAQAYCAWLSAQTGELYGLPTEAEWEAAARGLAGRRYAYGESYDASRGNTFETHLRRTTPVGVFPEGATPEGAMDMSGNVWQWTTSAYRPYPYVANDGREAGDDPLARRGLRGGSWDNNQYGARASCRYGHDPNGRYFALGCRVARRPPSHDH